MKRYVVTLNEEYFKLLKKELTSRVLEAERLSSAYTSFPELVAEMDKLDKLLILVENAKEVDHVEA